MKKIEKKSLRELMESDETPNKGRNQKLNQAWALSEERWTSCRPCARQLEEAVKKAYGANVSIQELGSGFNARTRVVFELPFAESGNGTEDRAVRHYYIEISLETLLDGEDPPHILGEELILTFWAQVTPAYSENGFYVIDDILERLRSDAGSDGERQYVVHPLGRGANDFCILVRSGEPTNFGMTTTLDDEQLKKAMETVEGMLQLVRTLTADTELKALMQAGNQGKAAPAGKRRNRRPGTGGTPDQHSFLREFCERIPGNVLPEYENNARPYYFFEEEDFARICFFAPEGILIDHSPVQGRLELQWVQGSLSHARFLIPLTPPIKYRTWENADSLEERIMDLKHSTTFLRNGIREFESDIEIRFLREPEDREAVPRLYLIAESKVCEENAMDELTTWLSKAVQKYVAIVRECYLTRIKGLWTADYVIRGTGKFVRKTREALQVKLPDFIQERCKIERYDSFRSEDYGGFYADSADGQDPSHEGDSILSYTSEYSLQEMYGKCNPIRYCIRLHALGDGAGHNGGTQNKMEVSFRAELTPQITEKIAERRKIDTARLVEELRNLISDSAEELLAFQVREDGVLVAADKDPRCVVDCWEGEEELASVIAGFIECLNAFLEEKHGEFNRICEKNTGCKNVIRRMRFE